METTDQRMTFSVSPYDNQISILYRAAEYFETPVRYLTVRDRQATDVPTENNLIVDDLVYEPFIDLLSRHLDESLTQAYDDLVGLSGTMSRREFAFLYYSLALSTQIPEEESFDRIQDFLDPNGFKGITDLRVHHSAWIDEWTNTLNQDLVKLDQIVNIQTDLENIPSEFIRPATELVVDRVTLRCFPVLASGEYPTRYDGLSIFDGIKMSYFVPYTHYNTGLGEDSSTIGKSYFKIYRGETTTTDVGSLGGEPNLSMIIPTIKTKAINRGDLIYATVWTGTDDQVIVRPTREGYTKAIYDLESGVLTFKTRISDKNPQAKELLIERIREAFPHLVLGAITETRISGEFDLYLGQTLEDYVFLHQVLNKATFAAYLYVDERQKAYPEKKRITIHYRSVLGEAAEETTNNSTTQSPASISAVLGQRYITDDQATADHPVGTPFIRVSITRGASRDTGEQFRQIFTLLMGIYLQDRDDIIATYNEYIPDPIEEEILPKEKTGRQKIIIKTGKAKRIIYQLQDAAPHIFVADYARRCQGHLQPLVITPAEVPAWEKKQFRDKKDRQLRSRQVMPFPPAPNSEILVVCPDDRAPYPGVKVNQLDNADVYPYIPCCNETDQTIVGKKTKYNAYYRGVTIDPRGEKRRMKIITAKILFSGGIGEISVPLERVLLRYSERASSFKRFGVPRDPNSFIHCVLEALNHDNYSGKSEEDKIILATQIRQSIPDRVHLSVTKQELFDFSLQDIRNQVITDQLFFDPALYYRLVEEMFNINIYTFTPGRKPKEDRGETIGRIDLPRHKLFHTRPLRLGRPTILIFKHWGGEADALEYPQCELLIDYDDSSRLIVKVFNDSMTQVAHDVLLQTSSVTTWSYQNNSLVTHVNLFSRVDFDRMTNQQATGQIIDEYGKMRGLIIPYNGTEITIFFLPSQPENLPIVEYSTSVPGQVAQSFLGQPVSVALNQEQTEGIGLWFSHPEIPEYPNAIFIPIKSTSDYLYLDQGPPPPLDLMTQTEATTRRVLRLQKQISLLLQIIRWLFVLYRNQDQDGSVDRFISDFVYINTSPVPDSSLFYDLSKIPHRLPTVQTAVDGIEAMSILAPSLASNRRVVLYSPTFGQKIRQYLQTFARQTQGLHLKPARYLDNYYVDESDFQPQSRTVILIGQDNLNIWLSSLQRAGYQGLTILTSLEPGFSTRIEPYLYLDPDGTMYLVQNVEDADLGRAIQVGVTWHIDQTNSGFTTLPFPDVETVPYRLYEISPSSTLRVKEEYVDSDSSEALQILQYIDGIFAALLPVSRQNIILEIE